jgi:tetratricopeptide (TPR) repeat protein
MNFRLRIAPLTLIATTTFAWSQVQLANQPLTAEVTALVGKVLNAEGRPASGIHVEIDDARTEIPVYSTYTQPDGSFELYNIPQGNYEVVADADSSIVSNSVSVDAQRPSLELRLPPKGSPSTSPEPTVSVAQMLVPSSAQKLYDKAYAAFQSGKYDQAEKQLDATLQIDPQFAHALTLRGIIQLNGANRPAGRESLERAVQLDPGETGAYIALAAIYNHEGRFDDALRASEKGLSLSPKAWQAYLEMAKASIAKSMYERGLKLARQAQRLGGNAYAEVHLVKAYALVPLKLYKDAKYELQAAMAHERQGQVAQQAQNMLAQVCDLEKPALANTH